MTRVKQIDVVIDGSSIHDGERYRLIVIRMKSALLLIVRGVLLLANFTPAPGPSPAPPAPGGPVLLVEGVASSRSAAPVAALRELNERLRGLSFMVYDGKYVVFGEGVTMHALETRDKRLIDLKELPTGLFRAWLRVEVPAGALDDQDKLRERTVEGEAEMKTGTSILDARFRARQAALEKAVLAAVAESYPYDSAPTYLGGKSFFLEAIRETIEGGRYRLVARVKIQLGEP